MGARTARSMRAWSRIQRSALDTRGVVTDDGAPRQCRRPASPQRMAACWAIQACMVTAAAAPALMDRTEPNWEM